MFDIPANGSRVKLSIILPVYNVEPYLERCLRSLMDQDIPREEYEIIVVNDGSPDNSREVAIRLMKEASNIVLIDQENRGVSMARNAGMERARGKYVIFIDPDDYVISSTFGQIIDLADAHQAEVATLGYRFLDGSNRVFAEVLYGDYAERMYLGIEAYHISRGDGKVDPDRSVGVLLQKEFLMQNNIRYTPGVPYLEDGEFLAVVMCLAKRCIFSDAPFYIRTTRLGSATNSRLFNDWRSVEGFILCAKNLRQKQTTCPTKSQKVFLNQPIVKFSLLAIQGVIHDSLLSSLVRLMSVREKLKEAHLSHLELESCIPLYRIYGVLYNVSPIAFGLAWMLKVSIESVYTTRKF